MESATPTGFWNRIFMAIVTLIRNIRPLPDKDDSEDEKFPDSISVGRLYSPDMEFEDYPIGTLKNMGNTCFLNSILYTLRFMPNFLHNVHHITTECQDLSNWHSRHNSDNMMLQDEITELAICTSHNLHEMFKGLHIFEVTRAVIPFRPHDLLIAVRNSNSAFKRNSQQDAHELLMNIMNALNETGNLIDYLAVQKRTLQEQMTNSGICRLLKTWTTKNTKTQNICGWVTRSITNDYRVIATTKLTCLECRRHTKFEEISYDIQVAVTKTKATSSVDNIYKNACVTTELMAGGNKYFCEDCQGLTLARREVSFQVLPKMLVVQMKRFTFTTSGYNKLMTFYPTPMTLGCFCEKCCLQPKPLHYYELCSVIFHIGNSLSSGHYMSYVRVNDKALTNPGCNTRCCRIKLNTKVLNTMFTKSGVLKDDEKMEEDFWLQCDDDKIKPLTMKQMEETLSYKGPSVRTPYLLFYSKLDDVQEASESSDL